MPLRSFGHAPNIATAAVFTELDKYTVYAEAAYLRFCNRSIVGYSPHRRKTAAIWILLAFQDGRRRGAADKPRPDLAATSFLVKRLVNLLGGLTLERTFSHGQEPPFVDEDD